jgi:DNA-binding NarL/FixJ family response regulator
VLLADDDPGMRAAIPRLLSSSCDVVSCVADTASLFDDVDRLCPDVVLLDLSLPGGPSGLEICRAIRSRTPAVKVVIFSAHDDPDFRNHAREFGAAAYVWKPQASDDLATTIHAVVENVPPRSADEAS